MANPSLYSPLVLKNFSLKNRIVVSPMCQYSAEQGFATDWHLVHLGQFAIGAAGAVIQEATSVSPEGRITYGDLGIWEDGQIEKYRQITEFIKGQGSIAGFNWHMQDEKRVQKSLGWVENSSLQRKTMAGKL